MINEIFMPALSSTMTEGKIVSWQKSSGDWVEKGETVVVVESDKADMDVESFFSGYLAAIIVEAGDVAPVGSTIGLLAETEAEIEQAKQQGGTGVNKESTNTSASIPTTSVATAPISTTRETQENSSRRNGRIIASPRARKLAKGLKVDLSTLKGTGPHGRIVAEDVEMAAGRTPALVAASVKTPIPTALTKPSTPNPPPLTSVAPASATSGQVVPMNSLQNAVAQNMIASLSVPTFHVGYTITTNNLDRLYKQIKSKGVTMSALLAKAVAVTLQQHPLLNAAYVEHGIKYASGINIAVAVSMPDGGLITPVLPNADKMDIYSLSRTWKGLVDRARAKQLQPDEYRSGTFTISNLGMFGVNRFDAILPPGQGSILAIGASQPQVVTTDDGMIGVKRQMEVNITCDHRIIYGADAATFLQDLAKLIETNPKSLTM